VRRLTLASIAALALALAAAAAATAGNGGIAPVEPNSENAEAIRQTYWLVLAITGAIFVAVEAALLVFIVRFRRGSRDRHQDAPQIHGATRLELSATIVPVLILAGIVAFVFVKLPTIKNVPEARAGDTLNIRVEGRQFYWLYTYPEGQVAVKRLVVPVGRVVTLDVVSNDVIHSWWVPALGGKIDAIPGETNHTWFQAKETGSFEVRCAELCGLEHAHMTGWVDVVTPQQYRAFLAGHRGASTALGKEIYDGVCATCHGLAGAGDYGPRIADSAILQDRRGLETLLREGKGKMPAVGATWSPETMRAAIDYLRKHRGR
jgi:cytochrome c oxidase subunit 2